MRPRWWNLQGVRVCVWGGAHGGVVVRRTGWNKKQPVKNEKETTELSGKERVPTKEKGSVMELDSVS